MLNPEQLHGYQNEMIDRLYEHDKSLVIADMGSGKTAATLTAILELIDDNVISRVLILAPLRVASNVWHNEVAEWSHLNGLTVTRAIGTEKKRRDAFRADSDVVTMNYENLQWLCGYERLTDTGSEIVPPAFGKDWPTELGLDGLVFDEVSRMKGGHSSKRFKALKPYLEQFKWIAGLTGTPSPNGLQDLYGITYVVDQGKTLGRTLTAFRQRYMSGVRYPTHTEWILKAGAEEQIYNDLAPTAYVLDPADYDTRPEPTPVYHEIELDRCTAETMRLLQEQFYDPDTESPAPNGGALVNKLQQLSNGFMYADDEAVHYDTRKLELCKDLVESLSGQPVIIGYKYKEDLQRLRDAFNAPFLGAGVSATKGEETIERWNAGEIPVLLLHPQSAGHGLNLQKGGHQFIWYSLPWSHEEYQQAIARIARQGQQNHVYEHFLLAGIDKRILTALRAKESVEDALIHGLMEEAA